MGNKSVPTFESIMKTLNEIAECQKESERQRTEGAKIIQRLQKQREKDEKRIQKQREEDAKTIQRLQEQREEDERKRQKQREEDEKKMQKQREEDEKKMQKQREEDERRMQKQREEDERRRQKQREEDKKKMEERQKEHEKFKKEMAEISKKIRYLTEQQIISANIRDKEYKKISRQFGKWGNELGYLVESTVESNLKEILNARNMNIIRVIKNVGGRSYDGSDEDWEFDFIAIGKKIIVVVEAKSTLEIKEVKRFLQKLRNINKWCPHYRGSKIYGGVAYLKDREKATLFAQEQGLFVIHAVGDAAKIKNPSPWTPKEILQAPFNISPA